MSSIYPSATGSAKKSWEGDAVKRPDAIRKLAENDYGLKEGSRLTIALLDDMLADAEKDGNTRRIQQINLAKTFVRQARKHKKRKKSHHKATASVASILATAGEEFLVVASQEGLDDFVARTAKFETHKPVTISYLHNESKAEHFGSRFAQDIEPAGFYMIENDTGRTPPEGWTGGTVLLENPLVLDWGSGSYQASDSWKQVLYRVYGLKGKALSRKLLQQGFTHIVTIDKNDSMEIVDLRGRPDAR
jgi:hypothetical protein